MRFKPALYLAMLVIVVAALAVLMRPSPQYVLSGPPDKETGAFFQHEIKEFGGPRAYARMAHAIDALDGDDQHGYAHAFGRALFSVEGERGIAACDMRFNFGCFHQFLGDAISSLGTSSISRLYAACGAVTGSKDLCEHGLGHGILAASGYQERDLLDALSLCDSVTHASTYPGCDGGAFMEYNIRTIASAEGTLGMREIGADPYAPCASVPARDRAACVFWLPQWWYYAAQGGSATAQEAVFALLGRRCLEAPDPNACSEGIGYVAPAALRYSHPAIRAACDAAAQEGASLVRCRGMAALIVRLSDNSYQSGADICSGLSPVQAKGCLEYAAHERDFAFTLPELP